MCPNLDPEQGGVPAQSATKAASTDAQIQYFARRRSSDVPRRESLEPLLSRGNSSAPGGMQRKWHSHFAA